MSGTQHSELKKIGSGAYGTVYYQKTGDKRYAIKKYSYKIGSSGISEDSIKDIFVYSHIAGVTIHKIKILNDYLYVTQSYYGKNAVDYDFNMMYVKYIFFNTLVTLFKLHSYNILHRDIKPQNILVNDGVHSKLIDYGISSFSHIDHTREVYTSWYRPPEVCNLQPYDKSAEIWALGIVIIEMIIGTPILPYENEERTKQFVLFYDQLKNFDRESQSPSIKKSPANRLFVCGAQKYHNVFQRILDKDLMMGTTLLKMVSKNPKQRPSVNDLLRSEFFKHVVDYKQTIDTLDTLNTHMNLKFKNIKRVVHENIIISIARDIRIYYNDIAPLGSTVYIHMLSNAVYIYYLYCFKKNITPTTLNTEMILVSLILSAKLINDKYSDIRRKPRIDAELEINVLKEVSYNIYFNAPFKHKVLSLVFSSYWEGVREFNYTNPLLILSNSVLNRTQDLLSLYMKNDM